MSDGFEFSGLEKDLKKATKEEEIRGKRRIFTKILIITFVTLIALILFGVGGVFILRTVGGRNLKQNVAGQTPKLSSGEGKINTISENGDEWQEDWIEYNGKTYAYNENILTFLVLGVDKDGEAVTSEDFASGGQSDGIFLVVCDPDKKHISCIAVNRDTMVPIKMSGAGLDGSDIIETAQICTQYGFGDGGAESCLLVKDAVSALFYGLPISGYASIRMTAIPAINDAVGGVSVTIPEDMTKAKSSWKEGSEVTLKGRDAYTFVRWRDRSKYESARMRLLRQKMYLSKVFVQAKDKTKENISFPIDLYNSISEYMVTDLSVSEVAYMASEYLGYAFNPDSDMIVLEGETKAGEKYEEFYPDEDKLKELMIEIFYKEVE